MRTLCARLNCGHRREEHDDSYHAHCLVSGCRCGSFIEPNRILKKEPKG